MCSGIDAASAAWNTLGWEAAAFSEIEPFACAVLKHHYPDVPNLGDMTRFKEWPDVSVDLLCGGTPCQSFSVAGLRAGMADPRGNLALVFLGVLDRYRPRWVVWENVPGVRSSNRGRDFGAFLGALGQRGYGWAYRSLDAQYFGLAQRRERVFVVGHLGDWSRAAAVLFERACLSWHPPPSRAKGKGIAAALTRGADSSGKGGYAERRQEDDVNLIAPTLPARTRSGGGLGTDFDCDGGLVPYHSASYGSFSPGVGTLLRGGGGSVGQGGDETLLVSHSLRADGFDASEDGHGKRDAASSSRLRRAPDGQTIGLQTTSGVRRLTPRECERLQGFPDDYTLIPYRRKPAADGPRYRAIGNSWAVPVVRWIAERIATVEDVPRAARSLPGTGREFGPARTQNGQGSLPGSAAGLRTCG